MLDVEELLELEDNIRKELDDHADGANLYLKQAELDGFGDWLNEAIKESNRLKLREWLIAIVGAAVGAIITKILTG